MHRFLSCHTYDSYPRTKETARKLQGVRSRPSILDRDRFRLCGPSTDRALAHSVTPDRKRDEQKIDNDKGRHIGLAADAESIGVKSLSEDEVYAVPGHQNRQETDDARYHQPELGPPAGQAAVQSENVTEQRDQCPGFLRIPTPEPSPGIIGPDTAENRAGG